MAGQDTTRIIIDLETRLRNLERTLKGLDAVKKKLDAIGQTGTTAQSNRAAANTQKLATQQQKLVVQTQELANRQERARQTTERLTLANQRLLQAQQQVSAGNRVAQRSALNLDQTLGRVGGSLRNLGLGLVSLGASLSIALTAPLTALGVLSARNAVTLDSLNRGLTAIVGSADEAGRQLTRLTNIAKLPGIGFQEAIQGSIRLQAVGFSAGVAERALIQFSNAVALTGGGREELARITVQLGQLSAKGKVLAQDLKPIIEAGPAVGRALLQAFGTVNSEDIQALGLSSQEFIEQLLSQLEKLPRAAAGLRNTFDNFSDAVFRASAAIGGAILPVLTRLIEVVEPIITRLAEGFAKLPAPVQTLVVTFGALAAAAGPALFVLGQFATGIGGLISAFGRLHALGLLPTIASFRLLTQVMTGSASLLAGQAATTAAAAAGWGALGVAILGVVALAGGIYLLLNAQKDAVKISKEQIAATDAQIATLKDQLRFTESLKVGVERTADEQERLAQIYADLNTQAKVRLTAITDEEKRLGALREELQRLLRLRNEERIQQAANLAASLAETAQSIQLGQQERDNIADRVRGNADLVESLTRLNRITAGHRRQLALQGITANTVEEAIGALNAENETLIDSQGELIKSGKDLNGTAEEQGAALRLLIQQTGLTARELLTAAKAMGVFKGNVEETLPVIERFIAEQERAAGATDAFTRALSEQNKELLKAGDAADTLRKQRKDRIGAAVSLAQEAATDFKGALAFLRAFAAAQPDLRAAIEKERQLTGKSFEEFVSEALGGGRRDRGGTGIRNAQEQLAKALAEGAEQGAERLREIERLKNEVLLEENENSFRLQLTSYRAYLSERARLTSANIGLEIDAQRTQVATFKDEEGRARERALKSGIGAAERTRAEAQATEAANKRQQAETEVLRLQERQRDATRLFRQSLAEAQQQQVKDIRQLDVEFAELTGRIEDALNTATVEKFRERLEALGRGQKRINEELQLARLAHDADDVERLETASRLNQSQIDLIELITQQEFATNKLAAANEFVRRAKDRQSELERQITEDVEFRGLTEDEALRRRLEGERKLANSLRVVRDLVQSQVDALNAQAVKPPQALIDFIRETNDAIRGLGELTFSEQFQLVEKEFNRLNDERLRRIAEVERAVRERDIAEIEGMLIIRRINGEYEGDLQRQIDLLKAIATRSNDTGLQKQAADLEQTAKDANSQLADFDRQLRSTSIDALRDGFTEFFTSLTDRTKTAREKLLDLVNSVAARIQQVIAENLSEKLIESLFGTGEEGAGGLLAAVKRVFGSGSESAANVGAEAVSHGAEAVEHTAVTAALTTGATVAGTTLIASMATAATSFASAVIAAGAAFASVVAGAASAQSLGGLGSALGAATGLFPAVPGGMYRVVEGGYPEAVITTDPKYAVRQVNILRELIQRTKGFGGRMPVPDFAMGGIVSRETAEANLLNSINRTPAFMPRLSDAQIETAAGAAAMNLRIVNQVSSRELTRPYVTSEEGTRDYLNIISGNANEIRRRLRIN